MNHARILPVIFALFLVACASTPESPGAGEALAGGFKSTGNPVLDAAMQASAQAATQAGAEQLQQNVPGLSSAQANAIAAAAASGDGRAAVNAAGNAALDQASARAKQEANKALSGAFSSALGRFGPAGALLGQSAADSISNSVVDAATGQARAATGLASDDAVSDDAVSDDAVPGAIDPATGLAVPYNPAAGAVANAAAPGSEAPYAAGELASGTVGEFKGRPLVLAPALESNVKIECYYSNFPPDRDFIPMEIKVTPAARLDELVVKVDPEDGVVMRDGPQTRSMTTPADPYFRRIFAARATDRDSFLRVSTVAKVSGSESKRSVLCPLARINKVPDTGTN